ncbi:uncharacterized protein LOC141886148 isoform X2 [Acropora palmata]|uniref:uncharacterized protein LOC141886148 isoform X2 n=1 Tax=Acropora palmata TaxID=6131 RepID=UPI003DA0E7BF
MTQLMMKTLKKVTMTIMIMTSLMMVLNHHSPLKSKMYIKFQYSETIFYTLQMGKDGKIPDEWTLLCTEGTTVQGNEEKHKAKDQEDCKITSRAPNKKRKRSNMEKSLDVFCERFTQISKEETERHLKAEEDRHKREMDFQLKQAQLENERRRSEREHEMNVLRLILSHGHVSTGRIHYPPNDNWGQNYPGMSANSMFQPCIPTHSSMDNISVSDSDGSTFATL